MTPTEPPGPLAGLDQAAHLHSLAERIHHAADDLPAPESAHSLASISEEVEDQVHVVAGIFASLAHEAAVHGRAVRQHTGAPDSVAHHKVVLMTRAADPLGWALAKLGEAVVQIGLLHEISADPRTPERAQALSRARTVLDERLHSAHRHLTDAAGDLHRDADLLVAAAVGTRRAPSPSPHHRTRPPDALPVPPSVSPATSRTRR
ncbi:hypothetical protein [Streptomyces sp. TLI_146]|uniref:hypothetical protein n=1 Tax=Streptomyces sp. TLI_146 TaxID=1938858 RepID=UPI000C70E8E9|nr:hypothetical protein [Streptomyces sp. TLI_146]PKV84305.1 hypothetical protein BX283_1821 [Streptomyces sp. TLI_146]